jgi:hypothetical protein
VQHPTGAAFRNWNDIGCEFFAYKLVAMLAFWKPMLHKEEVTEIEEMINKLTQG